MIRRAIDSIGWFVGSLMGDRHYDHYLRHMASKHPGKPVLSEAQYWRERHDDSERNPGACCC